MLGKNIYFLNFKDKTVGEGVVIQEHITNGGYDAYLIRTITGELQLERSICYASKEKAEKALERKQPLADKMNAYAKKATDRIDNMRTQLLGKPTLKHLVRK